MENNFIAWSALIVSATSALFSWHTLRQAKRQADAVMGDLPPVISLFQPEFSGQAFAVIKLEVSNFNRLPLYIDKVEFDILEGLRIFMESTDERDTHISMWHAIAHGNRKFSLDLPQRLLGSHPSAPPTRIENTFKITTSNSGTPKEPIDVKCTVWCRVDGEDKPIIMTKSITWIPYKG